MRMMVTPLLAGEVGVARDVVIASGVASVGNWALVGTAKLGSRETNI